MDLLKEEEDGKDDFVKGIVYFWRLMNLELCIRSVVLSVGILKVVLGNSYILFFMFDFQLLFVGDNFFGQFGFGDFKFCWELIVIYYFCEKCVFEICCGGQYSGVICLRNEIFFWGDLLSGQCGIGDIKLVN